MFKPNEAGFAALDRAVSEFERSIAERIADVSRGKVAVQTGETRDSIAVVERDGHAAVSVGGAGLYLELGTAHMHAEPFLRPSVDETTAEIPTMAREQLGATS